MKVKFTRRAELTAAREAKWWRKNRPNVPELFERELAHAIRQLETIPKLGTPHPTERRPRLLRLLLEKTACHVYFEADERKDENRILMLWGATRGRDPAL